MNLRFPLSWRLSSNTACAVVQEPAKKSTTNESGSVLNSSRCLTKPTGLGLFRMFGSSKTALSCFFAFNVAFDLCEQGTR